MKNLTLIEIMVIATIAIILLALIAGFGAAFSNRADLLHYMNMLTAKRVYIVN